MSTTPRTIRDQVTDSIREQVVGGELEPGQPLREVEFAQRFGVSRGPVRDAFLQLAKEGLLAYQANRGVTVAQPPKPEYRELIVSLRRQIECFVARRGVASVDSAAVAELEERLAGLRDACDAEDSAAVARHDVAFHECLLRICGGEDLLAVWRLLCSQMLMTYSRLEDYDAIHAEHRAIVDALRSRKKTALVRALEANVR